MGSFDVAALPREDAAQDAVACACAVLGRSPQLLAPLEEQQPKGGEDGFALELDTSE